MGFAMRVHKIHYGYNIRRLREIIGLKQAALAKQMGSGWTQKRISKLESREWIKPDLLERVAEGLGLSPQVIENFSEEALLHTLRQDHCLPAGGCCQNGAGILKELMEENNTLFAHLLKAENDKNMLLRCLTFRVKHENEKRD